VPWRVCIYETWRSYQRYVSHGQFLCHELAHLLVCTNLALFGQDTLRNHNRLYALLPHFGRVPLLKMRKLSLSEQNLYERYQHVLFPMWSGWQRTDKGDILPGGTFEASPKGEPL
jgi:hypothetical protein